MVLLLNKKVYKRTVTKDNCLSLFAATIAESTFFSPFSGANKRFTELDMLIYFSNATSLPNSHWLLKYPAALSPDSPFDSMSSEKIMKSGNPLPPA